jgi:glycosyltransferase involved in cell wall biosynthesis
MISCIVPVYNNETTIAHVLNTLLSCKDIGEVIAIDDCSQDNSADILRTFESRVKVSFNEINYGKGYTVVKGIRSAKRDHILTCDADLSKLQTRHIEALIQEYQTGDYDMVIARRESGRGLTGLIGKVSGERIYHRRVIEPYMDLIVEHGNGIEQIINYAHRGKKVKLIVSRDIGHIMKWQRGDLRGCVPAYTKEVRQLLETELILRKKSIARRASMFFQ